MAQEKKKSLLWFILKPIISIVLTLVLLVVGVGIFLKVKYDINPISTIAQIRTIREKVDEDKMCPNKFTDSDMVGAQTTMNTYVPNLITESEGVYTFNSDVSGVVGSDIKLTDKKVAAIINSIIEESGGISMKVGNKDIKVEFLQIQFSNLLANGDVDFNSVIKLDISSIKKSLNSFPINLVSKYLPDSIYISSTSTIKKGATNFAYTIESKSINVNNLNQKDSAEIIETINKFAKMGNSKEIINIINKPLIDACIGNNTQKGIAFSLKDMGAVDYEFELIGDIIFFVIEFAPI